MNSLMQLLSIRLILRDRKIFDLADMLKKAIEEIYHIEINDTKDSVCFNWKKDGL